jgi:hypothetical protein
MRQSNEADSFGEPAVSTAASRAGASGGTNPGNGFEHASAYCPRCSARLAARSCKLICSGCGYYMSCSDFI